MPSQARPSNTYCRADGVNFPGTLQPINYPSTAHLCPRAPTSAQANIRTTQFQKNLKQCRSNRPFWNRHQEFKYDDNGVPPQTQGYVLTAPSELKLQEESWVLPTAVISLPQLMLMFPSSRPVISLCVGLVLQNASALLKPVPCHGKSVRVHSFICNLQVQSTPRNSLYIAPKDWKFS